MDDLISRQAAIDVADRADYVGLAVEDVKKVTDEVVKELKQLPSSQPEKRTEERAKTHACDCISRQEAIDFFNELDKRSPHRVLRPEQARYILMRLPSAQPERKNGEWERASFYNGTPVCSECYLEGRWDWDFCPNCGADMRGKQDE